MKCDVAIIGAGPAGSTAGNLLAQHGIDVAIIEQSVFPRFHIGESLLPCDLPIFERLGVCVESEKYLRKDGADFVDERHGERVSYLFKDGLSRSVPHAWQVERAAFDHLLLKRAVEVGTQAFEGERVNEVSIEAETVFIQTSKQQIQARYVIDASGQDAFFARRDKHAVPIKGFGKAAIFCHFQGLSDEVQSRLAETGNIQILIVDKGWMWLIPLVNKRLSVGVVSQGNGIRTDLITQAIEGSPLIQRLTAGAEHTPPRVIRNFSYLNRKSSGSRFACVGDAACFLDPVFSSGVSLAMLGAERLADILAIALKQGREDAPDLLKDHREYMMHAYAAFSGLIHSFYNTSMVSNLFFAKDPDLELRAGLISMLAGDLWRTDNRFQSLLAQSVRRDSKLRWDPEALHVS
jgi:hypothetical protein